MPGHQRIVVVRTTADAADVLRARKESGRDPVVLTPPTSEAQQVVALLGVKPQVELMLAPVQFPQHDRGHRLDDLVRRHALADRFREVVVVADPATATLLLRVLAPDQLSDRGAVTVVGLARSDRPVDVRRAVIAGAVLGVAAGFTDPVLVLPAVAAVLGACLLVAPALRHVGRELLLASAIAVGVVFVLVAGSARFPGGW